MTTTRFMAAVAARGLAVIAMWLPGAAQANAYFDWQDVNPKILANAPRGHMGRAQVMSDLAAFNALNAITPRYRAYPTPGPALETVPDASPEAALASAMQTILVNVPGADTALLDKTYREQIAKVTDAAARNKGVLLGRRAALAMIAMRIEDDFSRVEQAKREPAAGVFELTPDRKMSSSIALTKTRPFALAKVGDYDPGPPLDPASAAAKRDAAEVKSLGARNSTARSGDQAVAAIFWNSGENGDSNALLKAITEKNKMSLLDSVRMNALLSMTDSDARLIYELYKDKYLYWRPYNAIRGRFADAALRDDKWEALIQTPANPDYPSGSGVAGGALARFFEAFNGSGEAAVPLTWRNSAIGVTRSWPNGEALGRELGYSRIWAGVHFRNSIEVGHKLGRKIMDDVLATQLLPLPGK
ncbi:MAG: vanadium-dependent haloperoxidase [Betaproteobacteria bacterium]|nr:vanadium-dependent haloperoxidase [Betaproteobacteria bacterium]